MFELELLHEGNEGFNTCFRHGVVDARTHAAYRAVALDALDAVLLRFSDEELIELSDRL